MCKLSSFGVILFLLKAKLNKKSELIQQLLTNQKNKDNISRDTSANKVTMNNISDFQETGETAQAGHEVTETNHRYSPTSAQNQDSAGNIDSISETSNTQVMGSEATETQVIERQDLEDDSDVARRPIPLPMDGFLDHFEVEEEAQLSDHEGTVDDHLPPLTDSDDQDLEEGPPKLELSEPDIQEFRVLPGSDGEEEQEEIYYEAKPEDEVRYRPIHIAAVPEPAASSGPAPNNFAALQQPPGWTWPTWIWFVISSGLTIACIFTGLQNIHNKISSAHDQYGVGSNTYNVTAIEWMTVTANPSATSVPMPTGTVSSILFNTLISSATPTPTAA